MAWKKDKSISNLASCQQTDLPWVDAPFVKCSVGSGVCVGCAPRAEQRLNTELICLLQRGARGAHALAPRVNFIFTPRRASQILRFGTKAPSILDFTFIGLDMRGAFFSPPLIIIRCEEKHERFMVFCIRMCFEFACIIRECV
jgi:hypothetical protein